MTRPHLFGFDGKLGEAEREIEWASWKVSGVCVGSMGVLVRDGVGQVREMGAVYGSLSDVVWASLRILACDLGWENGSVDYWVSGCHYVEV